MKKALFLILLFPYVFALDFYKDNKKVYRLHKGKIYKINGKSLTVVTHDVFNPWRKSQHKYTGVNFFKLLDAVYTSEWRKSRKISFKALDGYRQVISIKQMLKASKYKVGILAIGENGKEKFIKYFNKDKEVDPGPFYLVWNGFKENERISHGHPLKWPYMLDKINISN